MLRGRRATTVGASRNQPERVVAFPVNVTFQGVQASEALRAQVVERAHKLARFAGDISFCNVVVAADSQRRQHGNAYDIRIKVGLPGGDIEVRGIGAPDRQTDAYAAVVDTFDALRRRIEDRVRQRRGEVKTHANA